MKFAKIFMILGLILGFIVLFSFFTFLLYIKPPKMHTPGNPSDYKLSYENISFKTKDGLTLRGWFIPSNHSNNTIIIGHGFPFDKSNILHITRFLNEKYNLLYYDFRYFGESDGKYTTLGYKEKDDMLEAVNYLKKRKDVDSIGILGFSLSAATALMIDSDDVKAIVSDSAYASLYKVSKSVYFFFPWITKYPFICMTSLYAKIFLGLNMFKVSPEEHVKTMKIPILFIHGDKDSQISVENSKILHKNAPKSELWIIKGVDHGMSYAKNPKKYEKRVMGFFDKHLG